MTGSLGVSVGPVEHGLVRGERFEHAHEGAVAVVVGGLHRRQHTSILGRLVAAGEEAVVDVEDRRTAVVRQVQGGQVVGGADAVQMSEPLQVELAEVHRRAGQLGAVAEALQQRDGLVVVRLRAPVVATEVRQDREVFGCDGAVAGVVDAVGDFDRALEGVFGLGEPLPREEGDAEVGQRLRFLVAECESPATILGLILLARLFGVEERIDVSPLFETPAALERGSGLIEALLESPAYRETLARRGRL